MDHPVTREPHAAHRAHASIGTYLKVAAVLTVVTAIEYTAIYTPAVRSFLIPLLLVLSAFKFSLVVLFFMHLRYDTRPLAVLFVGPLVIATSLGVALMTLHGMFLLFGR